MKSKDSVESDASSENRTPRPIRDAGIGRFASRLKEAMGSEGMRSFARRVGISEGAVFSYLSGQTYPTLDRLDAIAAAVERPPAWFIGVETAPQSHSQQARLDVDTLRAATSTLIRVCAAYDFDFDPVEDADLLADFYAEGMDEGEISGENVIRLVERIAQRRQQQEERREGGAGGEAEGNRRKTAGKSR